MRAKALNCGDCRGRGVPSLAGLGPRTLAYPALTCRAFLFRRFATGCVASLAQVLAYPLFNSRQGFVQVLQRVGDTEAEIAFSVCAEGGAGEAGDTGLFEQRVGQFLGRPAGLRNVGEGVERAFGDTAGEAFDLVETGDEDVAAVLE